jgi:hypothetical protein
MSTKSIKYLNSDGLQYFLNKLKEYISDRIDEIYGETIKLNKNSDSKTVSEKIKEISDIIGDGDGSNGSIIDKLDTILSSYVKTITSTNQSELIKIDVTEDNEIKGKYVISLIDNGLEDLVTADKVTKFEVEASNEYIEVSVDKNTGNVKLIINEAELQDVIDSIKSYKVNGQSISQSGGINLTASDIKLLSNTDYSDIVAGDSVEEAVNILIQKLKALGNVVKIKSVHSENEDLSKIQGNNGDFIIVGQKEYVYWENTSLGENGTNWILLGDVSQILENLEDLESDFNNHNHKFTISSSDDKFVDESKFTGTKGTTTATDSLTTVSVITAKNELPTYATESVALSNHTHNVTINPTGTINSTFAGKEFSHNHTFTGTKSNTQSSGISVSYLNDTCSLVINTSHSHEFTPAGSVESESITPTGTITSTFSGTAQTITSTKSSSNTSVNSITSVGSVISYNNIEIPNSEHTHGFTPQGTIQVNIEYEGTTNQVNK